jgi:hypothetical protein
MSDLLDYDETLISSLHHIEDILVKFALQNYAAAGAVFLAYFTHKLSPAIMAVASIGLSGVFTWAIVLNILRYNLLWKLHRITRDQWLAGQCALSANLKTEDNKDCRNYLARKSISLGTFAPVVIVNLLPMAGAIVLLFFPAPLPAPGAPVG